MRWTSLRPALSAALGALALLAAAAPAAGQQPYPTIIDPPDSVARGGVVTIQLTADTATYTVGGVSATTNVFNRQYIPPTLRLNPGDAVALQLQNRLKPAQPDTQSWTNLHYHGFNVPPTQGADDVLLVVKNGANARYSFSLPSWHSNGMFWYHPHPHGISDGQVQGGMAGAILVGDLRQDFGLPGIREHVMLLRDPANGQAPNINGQPQSTIPIDRLEPQLWHLVNSGADRYFNLKLQNHRFWVLARDGNRVVVPYAVDSLVMTPGQRMEVLVVGNATTPAVADTLFSAPIATEAGAPATPRAVLGVLQVSQKTSTIRIPTTWPADRATADTIAKVWNATPSRARTFTFTKVPGATAGDTLYEINNLTYDPGRVDVNVALGAVEDWTLVNSSNEVHAFHIHQLDFLVLDDGTGKADTTSFRDVVNLPIGKTVRVRIPFEKPLIQGEFVFHCHLLFHEDQGMMQNVCVGPGGTCSSTRRGAGHGGHGGAHAHPPSP